MSILFFLGISLLFSCRPHRPDTSAGTLSAADDTIREVLYPWFPTRMHAFIWRNWTTASLETMAKVLETTPGRVREAGRSMGLPPHHDAARDLKKRGYISLIRRNWNLVSYDQMLVLLGWDAGQLESTLLDDDFLWVKMGGMRPAVPPVRYAPPSPATQRRCAEIKKTVREHFGGEWDHPGEARFAFVGQLSAPLAAYHPPAGGGDAPRIIYSYFAPYGDPLLDPEADPFPEGLLQRLSLRGVNGVWLHVVLHQLTASTLIPGLGEGHETRLKNLRRLARRTQEYGISIYLYMNEPRAMPLSFFEGREELLGVVEGERGALCTSVPLVRQWMKESLTHIFREVPELGGVFAITASENLTNCWSHRDAGKCPRCSKRAPEEVIAEVNRTIAEGVWEGNPRARVIVWDWGWPDGTAWGKERWAAGILRRLPAGVWHMSVSEWSKPVCRGGVTTTVGEYSISVPGPGPRALRLWKIAKEKGLPAVAKIQVNNTWELSAIPYLPVMNLIAEHIAGLREAGVDGLMLSWSLGGYPSPNLGLVQYMQEHTTADSRASLRYIAGKRYGKEAAPGALKAWEIFSRAFTEFPYGLGIYFAPMQYGPANPLYPGPTHRQATMLGFPYDDLKKWRGVYPDSILASQFEKLAGEWQKGLSPLAGAVEKAGNMLWKEHAEEDLRFATAAWLHFRSVACQIRFVMVRDSLLAGVTDQKTAAAMSHTLRELAREESRLAKELFSLTREDSRIGFEASNHYYYFPVDLVEKVINCDYVVKTLK